VTAAPIDIEREEKRLRLARLGQELDGRVRRLYAAGVGIPEIAHRLGLERESVRAAICGWASTQARLENARRRRA
jgi:hypothetical protein